ncbi:hypothetical protein QTQ03_25330 [Micromonospora sp. WMMA1363]|uniref:hypothetical protein n=1 Tax=Micromonospora sp. WMMA1363 TaxID=3053985 RepID=UPI00259C6FAF|nr:hypothetical protein [Micromonospora sp. WMMA1363]MDM4722758.1 hypothetical protein [Micromonospora sp. WMMA1363]
MYSRPHQHDQWIDHRIRVDVTTAVARNVLAYGATVGDLSCGDAAVAMRLRRSHGARLVLGDLAPGYELTGPIEETINQIESVDLFLCTETIEHLDDPDAVLAAIRPQTQRLLLSTPDGETDDTNPEHVWGWDATAVDQMLRSAGFVPDVFASLDMRLAGGQYNFQIWACR